MNGLGTWRKFLGWANGFLTAGGLAGQARPLAAASNSHPGQGEDYYEKLGVTKIVNARIPEALSNAASA
jgi:hypothetical protein